MDGVLCSPHFPPWPAHPCCRDRATQGGFCRFQGGARGPRSEGLWPTPIPSPPRLPRLCSGPFTPEAPSGNVESPAWACMSFPALPGPPRESQSPRRVSRGEPTPAWAAAPREAGGKVHPKSPSPSRASPLRPGATSHLEDPRHPLPFREDRTPQNPHRSGARPLPTARRPPPSATGQPQLPPSSWVP